MSQSELSQKALALKKASASAESGAARPEEAPAISDVPAAPATPAAARAPPGIRTILRMPQVEAATGLKQSHIYALISQGKFPRGVKLSSQATGWFADEIAQWQEERPRAMGGWSPRDRRRRQSSEAGRP
jgi:prophage regulatory protein